MVLYDEQHSNVCFTIASVPSWAICCKIGQHFGGKMTQQSQQILGKCEEKKEVFSWISLNFQPWRSFWHKSSSNFVELAQTQNPYWGNTTNTTPILNLLKTQLKPKAQWLVFNKQNHKELPLPRLFQKIPSKIHSCPWVSCYHQYM